MFNQFVTVWRHKETVSNTRFAVQSKVLKLFKKADKAFIVEDVFPAVLLTEFAKKTKNAMVLARARISC